MGSAAHHNTVYRSMGAYQNYLPTAVQQTTLSSSKLSCTDSIACTAGRAVDGEMLSVQRPGRSCRRSSVRLIPTFYVSLELCRVPFGDRVTVGIEQRCKHNNISFADPGISETTSHIKCWGHDQSTSVTPAFWGRKYSGGGGGTFQAESSSSKKVMGTGCHRPFG